MSSRFHDKYHGANHNSVSAIGIPDSGRDPIASYVFPYEGEFIMNNSPRHNGGEGKDVWGAGHSDYTSQEIFDKWILSSNRIDSNIIRSQQDEPHGEIVLSGKYHNGNEVVVALSGTDNRYEVRVSGYENSEVFDCDPDGSRHRTTRVGNGQSHEIKEDSDGNALRREVSVNDDSFYGQNGGNGNSSSRTIMNPNSYEIKVTDSTGTPSVDGKSLNLKMVGDEHTIKMEAGKVNETLNSNTGNFKVERYDSNTNGSAPRDKIEINENGQVEVVHRHNHDNVESWVGLKIDRSDVNLHSSLNDGLTIVDGQYLSANSTLDRDATIGRDDTETIHGKKITNVDHNETDEVGGNRYSYITGENTITANSITATAENLFAMESQNSIIKLNAKNGIYFNNGTSVIPHSFDEGRHHVVENLLPTETIRKPRRRNAKNARDVDWPQTTLVTDSLIVSAHKIGSSRNTGDEIFFEDGTGFVPRFMSNTITATQASFSSFSALSGVVKYVDIVQSDLSGFTVLGHRAPNETVVPSIHTTTPSPLDLLYLSGAGFWDSNWAYVAGDTKVGTNLYVTDHICVGGNAGAPSTNTWNVITANNAADYELIVIGDAFVSHDLLVKNNADINFDGRIHRDLIVDRNSTTKGNNFVSGYSVFNGDVSAKANAYVSGNQWVKGNTYVSGDSFVDDDLHVSGNSIVKLNSTTKGNNFVSGYSVFNGDVSAKANEYVSGNSVVKLNSTTEGNNFVSGYSVFNGDVSAKANEYVSGNSTVKLNSTTEGNNFVSGYSVFNGDVSAKANEYVSGNQWVKGNAHVSGTLAVNGAASFNSTVKVVQSATIGTSLSAGTDISANQNVHVGGNFSVYGTSTQNGNANFGNDVIVASSISAGTTIVSTTDISAGHNVYAASGVSVGGDAGISGNLTVGESIVLRGEEVEDDDDSDYGTLEIGGNAEISGYAIINGNLSAANVYTDEISMSSISVPDWRKPETAEDSEPDISAFNGHLGDYIWKFIELNNDAEVVQANEEVARSVEPERKSTEFQTSGEVSKDVDSMRLEYDEKLSQIESSIKSLSVSNSSRTDAKIVARADVVDEAKRVSYVAVAERIGFVDVDEINSANSVSVAKEVEHADSVKHVNTVVSAGHVSLMGNVEFISSANNSNCIINGKEVKTANVANNVVLANLVSAAEVVSTAESINDAKLVRVATSTDWVNKSSIVKSASVVECAEDIKRIKNIDGRPVRGPAVIPSKNLGKSGEIEVSEWEVMYKTTATEIKLCGIANGWKEENADLMFKVAINPNVEHLYSISVEGDKEIKWIGESPENTMFDTPRIIEFCVTSTNIFAKIL